jgi:hypothetical protein
VFVFDDVPAACVCGCVAPVVSVRWLSFERSGGNGNFLADIVCRTTTTV